jgi:thiamine kinase-like enzyme
MIDQILKEMNCGPAEQWDIQSLAGGLSNQNFLLSHHKSGEKFVLKMPPQSFNPANRAHEIEVFEQCAALGIAPSLVGISQQKALLSHYIEGSVLTEGLLKECPSLHGQCINLIQRFHQSVQLDFSMSYEKIMFLFPDFDSDCMFGQVADYHVMVQVVLEVLMLVQQQEQQHIACHNDLILSNFIVDRQQKCWLIDFEWSGNNNLYYDLAKFCIFSSSCPNKIIQAYFGILHEGHQALLYMYKMLHHYLVAQWCSSQLQETQLEVITDLKHIGRSHLNSFIQGYKNPQFRNYWKVLV